MAKLLLLSTNFASPSSTNGQIARTFFGELCRQGHEVTVITSDRYGVTEDTGFPNVHIIHTPRWFLFIIYLLKILSRDLAQLWEIDQFCYRLGAHRLIKKILSKEHYDAVHSICIGYSPHLIASRVKAETGLTWIAQFYDPWHDNFYRTFRHAAIKRMDSANEALVAKEADFIIHSNQTVCDLWVERYGEAVKSKIVLIPFNLGSVPAYERPVVRKGEAEKVRIVHIGNLYKGRDSFAFIHAVEALLQSHPDLRSRVDIQYIGGVSPEEKDYIRAHGLSDLFTLVGTLPEAACTPYFLSADIFLAIDAAHPSRSAFFPSKLIKYFYFRKPILGITPVGSPSYYAYLEGKYDTFSNDDTEGIVGYLLRALSDYDSICGFDRNYWKNYTNEYLTTIYQQRIVAHLP